MELVEKRDASYLQTFWFNDRADVDETEMMLSESDSKYVYGNCQRKTFAIEKYHTKYRSYQVSLETSSETSSENMFVKQSAKRRRTS